MNAFGILAMATVLFGNKIVVSKFYEVTSIMIHLMPLMIMYVITDVIMVDEQKLPENERRFCTLSKMDHSFSLESFTSLIKPALTYYSVWAISYYILVLIIGSYLFEFKKHGYYPLCDWMFQSEPWKSGLQGRSETQKRIIFMILSYTMYFAGAAAALITFYNEYARVAYVLFVVTYALWNGNKSYIDLFSYTK